MLAECNGIFRAGLVQVLNEHPGTTVVAVCHDADAARAAVTLMKPDVLLTAVRMPPTHTDEGVALACELADTTPNVAVVLLSRFVERSYATRLFGSGSERRGYLGKNRLHDPEALVEVLRQVANGERVVDPDVVQLITRPDSPARRGLSPSEESVLAALAEGTSNKGIADRHHLSARAVERSINSIFKKLGLPDDPMINRRVAAARAYARAPSTAGIPGPAVPITPMRQAEVFALIAAGHTNAEIAARLSLSLRTVEMHRHQGIAAVDAQARVDLLRRVLKSADGPPAESLLMVLVADKEMNFTEASPLACRVLGYGHAELLGMRVPDIVLDRTIAETLYAEYLAAGEQHGTITLRRKDGSLFEAAYAAHVRQRPEGEPYVCVLLPSTALPERASFTKAAGQASL